MSNHENLSFQTTLMVRDTCLCLHLQRAARAIGRHFDEAFRPLDLTSGQFSLLMALNRPEPPNMGQVATVLALDRTTLTANLKPLERRGLVAASVDRQDRRNRRLTLTDAGKRLLEEALPIWTATHAEIEWPLANPDRLRRELMALSQEPLTPAGNGRGEKWPDANGARLGTASPSDPALEREG